MRTLEEARAFADHWIAAWNTHDLEAILSHYADDVVFHSPRIEAVTGRPTGFIAGKSELQAYWTRALSLAPDLRFILDDVYVGRDTITIAYRNHRAQYAAETLIFNSQGLVREGVATYR